MPKLFSILLLGLTLSSCGHASQRKPSKDGSLQFIIRPGEVTRLVLPRPPKENSELWCRGQKVPYYLLDADTVVGYLSETYFSDKNPYSCAYKDTDPGLGETMSTKVADIEVQDKEFPHEFLKVPKTKVDISQENQKRIAREQAMLNKVYQDSGPLPLFQTAFLPPLTSKVTSIYGTKRTFNGKHNSQHLGTDYRASVGVPIPAANSGRVVLSMDLFYTGYTVILDHGLGIFTMYGHMSKLLVKHGEFVPQGIPIGLSGATGRASGPHLHWGVKVQGQWIDGDSLILVTQQAYANQ